MFIYYKCNPEQENFFNMRLCIKRLKPLIQKYSFTSKGKIKEYWFHNIQIISDMKQLLFYSHEDLDTNYENGWLKNHIKKQIIQPFHFYNCDSEEIFEEYETEYKGLHIQIRVYQDFFTLSLQSETPLTVNDLKNIEI